MSPKPAERQYEELKTELTICEIGGLFLAICDNENIPESVISRMQENMPEYFHFRLQMTDEKLIFPIFFTQTFEHIGKQSDIFHVLGIEKLSEKSQSEFIQSLQYGREQFKALPYSVVFWVQPEFIKTLFHAAPDFHHWVFGTYDFTGYQNDNNSSYQEKEKIFLRNIDDYLEKLIWEYEHWQEVKDSGKDFLLEVMSRANLYAHYVRMFCKDQKYNIIKLAEDILQEFLVDNQQSFMTMLGDFGTGKSSFSLNYFIDQARLYLSDKSTQIPLFISLKDYPKKLDIQIFIQNEFGKKFNRSFSLAVFQSLMLRGKFLFFVDGFDEMISMSNNQETIQNFKELCKLSFEHLQFMTLSENALKNKIFMTCRTHYFFTEEEENDFLKVYYPVLYRNYVTKNQYQILRIYIQKFSEEQIKLYVLKNTGNEVSTQEILKTINDTYNLKELANRPLLLAMIVKTLPILKDKQQINAYDLYYAYTNDWIERDDWRSQMTPYGKRRFMWKLALKMYEKGGDFSLHHSQLDKPKKEFFKSERIKNEESDYFVYETTTCSFLNRGSSGNYKFIHKSFMEYFLAEFFFDCIKNINERPIEYLKTNNEIKYFITLIISNNKQDLRYLNLSDLILKQANLKGGNLEKADLRDADLEKADLRDANLEKADLRDANLREANLEKANLRGANLEGKDFLRVNLGRANFEKANFREANLEGANLEGKNLEGVSFIRANLEGTSLKGTSFKGAYLYGANFRNANLNGVNFERADLRRANLEEVDIEGANLHRANLEGAKISPKNVTDIGAWFGQLLKDKRI